MDDPSSRVSPQSSSPGGRSIWLFPFWVLLFFLGNLLAEEVASKEVPLQVKWRALFAHTQNLHYGLSFLDENTGSDPSNHEEDLTGVDEALDALVEAGELASRKVRLIPAGQIPNASLNRLFEFAQALLASEYGHYVAREMVDLGGRLAFLQITPSDRLELHLRMPAEDLQKYLNFLTKNKLLAKTEEDAPTPAERPEKPKE